MLIFYEDVTNSYAFLQLSLNSQFYYQIKIEKNVHFERSFNEMFAYFLNLG